MASRALLFHGSLWVAMGHVFFNGLTLLALASLIPYAVRADGVFVWDKAVDINEPTQKAIIVHDAGREDLLLQVKYEGPLEEFGWLIPVPSLPTVEKGSMEPFYELSELTQRRFGWGEGSGTLSASLRGDGEGAVKVIETKTVGAYEVSVLSAQDTGGLSRWLAAHDYSIPDGKSEILDGYIRRGWYFVAAKIELNKGIAFKTVSSAGPKDPTASSRARETLQKQLASGELHPLLISFDTPKCVFPLRITAVGGKPSEVSLYVLSPQPLLEKSTFRIARENLDQRYQEWAQRRPENARARVTSMQNMRAMQFAWMMYAQNSTNRSSPPGSRTRNWSTEDLSALAKESTLPLPEEDLGEVFYAYPDEPLQTMKLESGKIPKSCKVLRRLQGKEWHLTKQVRTFAPEEMEDLEFEPAIPVLTRILPEGIGCVAAQLLARFGPGGVRPLVSACTSSNSTERLNALIGLEQAQTALSQDTFLALLEDESPRVRLHAIRCGPAKWDQQTGDALIGLLRDSHPEIGQEAAGRLCNGEKVDRTAVYLELMRDPDPNVRMHALGVALWINRPNPPPAVLAAALEQLEASNEDVRGAVLHILWKMDHNAIPRAALMPMLNSSRAQTVFMAVKLIEGTGLVQPALPEPEASAREAELRARRLSSEDLAVLATNQLGELRFLSLQLLERNGDAKAVELVLPLLRDSNSVVRSRAFTAIRNISGQSDSDSEPEKWERWWVANKGTFKPTSGHP